ncbi:MAG: exodeoxyribonuclease V subunit gamma [Spirochaetaceae bacterium]|jgi:DNA helicase-2/ATP-dependent DNA helicase PcrA|nr:exodeoxyribonuclease V subunit gamma [Spirochaetaceae bacterium]
MAINYRAELNDEQYAAVTTIDGPLLIIAGAGSGKTRVITFRIAYMLDNGIPQHSILALTFTNKAAREMEERIKELTGKKLQNMTISTFHAFGVKILRQDIERLGWRENFSIYDEVDRNQLIKDTGRELGFTADSLDVYKIGALFSGIKSGHRNWENANDQYRKLYEEYQAGLKLYNAVDFDDLIVLPIKLFREHPDVLEKYRQRYRYIMVDEFQDTSIQQYQFMHMLATGNVAVVGDDDQSIDSWRGANYENIRMFERDFPDLREIKLEQNYRSTETILEAANGVISHNTNRKEKALWSGNGSGRPIEIYLPENETAEADFVADTIRAVCMADRRKYDDFGVLVRANTLTRAIEEAFLDANIPYTVSGGTSFFQRKEINDIISYLRVIANHDDDINLLRIINTPRRGIGRRTIEQISEFSGMRKCSLWTSINAHLAAEDSPLSEKAKADLEEFVNLITEQRAQMLGGRGLSKKVKAMVDTIDYLSYLVQEYQKNEKAARYKLLNIDSLINSIDTWEKNPDNFDPGLFAYLNRITLLSRDDMDDDSGKGKVNLMTIHASKGLEFPVVFIIGAEDGIIPHARSLEEGDGSIEEERRLFYVAITRARDKLFLSSCSRRRKIQSVVECVPSPFLQEIPPHLVEYHEPAAEVEADKAIEILANMKKRFTI